MWAVFHDGNFQAFEVGEDISYLPEAAAVCRNKNCGGEFKWRQRP